MGNTWSEFWEAKEETEPQTENPRSTWSTISPVILKEKPFDLPKLSIHDLMNELAHLTERKEGTSVSLMHLLIERGYAVITVDADDDKKVPETYLQLRDSLARYYTASEEFFAQEIDTKTKHSDPRNENKGYVMINGLREYLKLRKIDQQTLQQPTGEIKYKTESNDPIVLWPSHPQGFQTIFNNVMDPLMELSWACFKCLYLEAHKGQDTDESFLKDMRACIEEKGSISIIHYFPPSPTGQNEACESDPKLERLDHVKKLYPLPDPADMKEMKVVCSTHQDTGILTFIICSEVPALQIFDRKYRTRINIEHLSTAKRDIVVMVGQKGPMFVNSQYLEPTPHRVLLKNGLHRTSMAFLFDVAK